MTATAASPATNTRSGRRRAGACRRQPGGAPALGDVSPPARSVARLGLLIGNQRLLVDLAEAGEIIALPPVIVPVPLTRDWFLGVTNVRGSLFTVVDLRRFAGDGVTEIEQGDAPAVARSVARLQRHAGRQQDAGTAQHRLDDGGGRTARRRIIGASWLGNSFADADGHIWRELSLSRLIATPDFLMVGR